jgi:hypothetical protein
MNNDELGWRGKKVKHEDGRTGIVRREYSGYGFVSLTIRVDGTDAEDVVQLNSVGLDSGATGWSWLYSSEGQPEKWAQLGDHNPEEPVNG